MSLTNKGHYLVNMFVSCVDIRANQTFENFYVTLLFLSWSFCQDVLTVCTLVLDFCIVVCTLTSSTSFNLYYRLRWPYIIQVMLSVFGVFWFWFEGLNVCNASKAFFSIIICTEEKNYLLLHEREDLLPPMQGLGGSNFSYQCLS